jgi:CTP:molybdopterin cytidylyltransferase MocA
MSAAVGAIVLAAGASRRLGRPKQLLMCSGETLLERAVRLAGESGAAPVLTVLGANYATISASVDLLRNSIPVINDQWEKGMATSIHAGIKALDDVAPWARGVLILTCDQPRLSSDHLRALIERFVTEGEIAIVASTYAGVVGIPAVFSRTAFPELLALHGDKGARALLMKPPCPLVALPFAGGEVDIDEPEDLAQLE